MLRAGGSVPFEIVPRSGPLLRLSVRRVRGTVLLSYRERGTGRAATLALTTRGAGELSRVIDGTRVCVTDKPAELELLGEVRERAEDPTELDPGE